ncbi:MAG: polyamine aminopropyltransferase [Spirochaetia bacterium]|nr:polyamine aminopropyltransferase [Spirochaetia bacterium]
MEKKLNLREDLLVESLSPDMGYYFKSENVLVRTKTDFQDLEVHDVAHYGRVLRLDGVFQTSDRDEFLYHEPLCHVPGISINGSKTALVIGGGDGGAAEEILKYSTVQKVVMVELDEGVVRASKKYIPGIAGDAFESSKLELRFEDGIKYIRETREKFDHVLLDLTDPFGPSVALYTKDFYSDINRILNPNGMLSLHIESPITRPAIFAGIYWTLKSVFNIVRPMLNYVPLYGTLWGFATASQNVDPMQLAPAEVQKRLDQFRLPDLKFYNANTHFSLMSIPNYISEILSKQTEPFTLKNFPNVEKLINRNLKIVEDEAKA